MSRPRTHAGRVPLPVRPASLSPARSPVAAFLSDPRQVSLVPVHLTGQVQACGECSACCTIMAVEEIGKPYYVRCQSANGAGCDCYADRPPTCRSWGCIWNLDGRIIGGDENRPDRLGAMFAVDQSQSPPGLYLTVFETRPGGLGDLRVEGMKASGRLRPEVDRIARWVTQTMMVGGERFRGVKLIPYGLRMETKWPHAPDGRYGVEPDDGNRNVWADLTNGKLAVLLLCNEPRASLEPVPMLAGGDRPGPAAGPRSEPRASPDGTP